MRGFAYVAVGFFLVLLQGSLFRFLAPLEGLQTFGVPWGHYLQSATPNLVLPLVVYLGIHEHSMARGGILSFCLGWALDLLGGGPGFLFRFTLVAIWWLSRAASSRVSAQSIMTRVPLALAASLAESMIVLTLLAIFGSDSRRPLELSALVLPRALGTALFAPFVFRLAQRLQADAPTVSSAQNATSGA